MFIMQRIVGDRVVAHSEFSGFKQLIRAANQLFNDRAKHPFHPEWIFAEDGIATLTFPGFDGRETIKLIVD